MVPAIDLPHDVHPSTVNGLGIELGDPRARPLRNRASSPDADFGRALHGVLPAIGLLHADGDDVADRLVLHEGAQFAGIAARAPDFRTRAPGRIVGRAGLAVAKGEGKAFRQGRPVQIDQSPAVAARNEEGLAPVLARGCVPQVDQREQPVLDPGGIAPSFRFGRVGIDGNVLPRRSAVERAAVLAIAGAAAVPAIAEETIDRIAARDLFDHLGHQFEIIGAVGAGEGQVGRAAVALDLAVRASQRPFGMCGGRSRVHRVRIDAGEHAHAQRLGAHRHVAERINALANALCHAMIGDRRWIEGDAAPGAQANGVSVDLPEIVDPEGRIVPARIIFGEGKLEPAHGFARPIGHCAVARPERKCRFDSR